MQPAAKTLGVLGLFVLLHGSLLLVCAAVLLSMLLLGLVLAMADVGTTPLVIVLTLAPVLTILAGLGWLRRLRRMPPTWWLGASCWVAFPVGAVGLLTSVGISVALSAYDLDGPRGPRGHSVRVAVRDAFGIAADFRADVEVFAADGTVVASWRDAHGQGPGGAERLCASMHWRERTLHFTSRTGLVELTLP